MLVFTMEVQDLMDSENEHKATFVITIGNDKIEGTVIERRGEKVRVGLTAPDHIAIHREAVFNKVLKDVREIIELAQTRDYLKRLLEKYMDAVTEVNQANIVLAAAIRQRNDRLDIIKEELLKEKISEMRDPVEATKTLISTWCSTVEMVARTIAEVFNMDEDKALKLAKEAKQESNGNQS